MLSLRIVCDYNVLVSERARVFVCLVRYIDNDNNINNVHLRLFLLSFCLLIFYVVPCTLGMCCSRFVCSKSHENKTNNNTSKPRLMWNENKTKKERAKSLDTVTIPQECCAWSAIVVRFAN